MFDNEASICRKNEEKEKTMNEMRNNLVDVFLRILHQEGMIILNDPKRFAGMVSDYTKGQLEHDTMLVQILRERLIECFANGDLSSSETVDQTAQATTKVIAEKYSLSYEWTKEVTDCLAEAIKIYNNYPRMYSDDKANKTEDSHKKKDADEISHSKHTIKIIAGLLLIAIITFAVIRFTTSIWTSSNSIAGENQIQEPSEKKEDISNTEKEADEMPEAYLQFVKEIRDSAERVEEGKLVCPAHFETGYAFDGGENTLLYESYAHADVDGDGMEELIVWYENLTTSLTQIMSIYKYNDSTERLSNIGSFEFTRDFGPDHCRFFKNGIIRISFETDEYPSYVFINDITASKYDWSAYNLLSSEHHNALSFSYDRSEDRLKKQICNTFDVPESVEVSEDEIKETMKSLESGEEVKVSSEKFVQ